MEEFEDLLGGSFDLTNVQDVVRQLFQAMARTLKQQSVMLSRVEQRALDRPTHSEVERIAHKSLTNSSLNDEIRELSQKVHDKPVRFEQIQELYERLQSRIQIQESTINSLQSRVESLSAELSSARIQSPKIYVDKQLTSLEDRITEQLEALHIEKQQNLQRNRASQSLTEPTHLENMLKSKADIGEIRALEAKILDRTTRDEMQHTITAQLRPLITAMSSIEKLVQVTTPFSGLGEMPYSDTTHPDISPAPLDANSPSHPRGPWRQPPISYPHIQQIVEDAVKQHDSEGGGKITHAQLQTHISTAREGMLRTLDTQLHGMRTQLVDDLQNEIEALRNEMLTRVSEIKVLASGTKDSLERTQTEMVRVLNKKAYKSEVQRLLQDKADRSELEPFSKESLVQQMLRTKADISVCEDEFTRTNHALSRQSHDVNELRTELRREVERVTLKLSEKANADDLQGFKLSSGATGDWKTLAINLRREVAEKASKEDLTLTFTEHTAAVSEKIARLTAMIEEKAPTTMMDAIDEHVTRVDRRISTELLGGRWLWRSGRVHKGGWVPWEVEVLNSAPESFQWKREVACISTVVPGLYHVCVGFFTNVPSTVQLCVNGEPVFTLEPIDQSSSTASVLNWPENQYLLRRSRHSAGDVTCLSIDEYLALPAQATVAARFTSTVRAQGFLSLRKL